ncbi:MAG TPA: hypothetical protein VFB79_22520 [Candidatus Angelobacter sp.]|nr:hypothetical protein [Candidatus Angelobacter sp.]
MDVIIELLGLLIGIIILFALLRLFRISNDLKAIREHICNKENADDNYASAAKIGSGPLGL